MKSNVVRSTALALLLIVALPLLGIAQAKVSLDAGTVNQTKFLGVNQVAHHGGHHNYNRGFRGHGFNHGFHRRNFGFNRGFRGHRFNRGFHRRGFNNGFRGHGFNRGFRGHRFNRGFRRSSFGFFFIN